LVAGQLSPIRCRQRAHNRDTARIGQCIHDLFEGDLSDHWVGVGFHFSSGKSVTTTPGHEGEDGATLSSAKDSTKNSSINIELRVDFREKPSHCSIEIEQYISQDEFFI
jgi:hypothetical protein